jgi:hypothetical protein
MQEMQEMQDILLQEIPKNAGMGIHRNIMLKGKRQQQQPEVVE